MDDAYKEYSIEQRPRRSDDEWTPHMGPLTGVRWKCESREYAEEEVRFLDEVARSPWEYRLVERDVSEWRVS